MLQRRFGVLTAVMAIASSLVVTLPALADSNVRIVRLSHINGDAQINHNSKDQGFTHAVLNMPVTSGMWLYTPNGGRAEVEFENGSTVRLIDESQIQFEKLALTKSGGKVDTITVDHGVAYFNFNKVSKDDQIRINVDGRTFRVSKAAHLRLTADEKVISLAVLHGQAKLEGIDSFDTEVKENQTLYVDAADALRFKVVKGTDKLGSDTWDKKRDDEVVALNARTSNNNLAYLNAYDAQFSSLGAYGNFFSVPGYGMAWQPFGMGPGWDPYSAGLWGMYPGMGYMWISSYPWGWAPYRYGQWNYTAGNGWFWVPGSSFSAFNYGPSIGATPAGWHAPTAPMANASVRPGQMVVVGNPPNVHPAVLSGHAQLNTHPAPVVRSAPLGMAAANRSQGGRRGVASASERSTMAGSSSRRGGGGAAQPMSTGPATFGGASAGARPTMVGGSGGRPK